MNTAIKLNLQSGRGRALSQTKPPRFYNLRALMLKTGVNQTDLAAILQKSRMYISSRMNGTDSWSVEDMEAMARAFDIPLKEWMDYFYEGDCK